MGQDEAIPRKSEREAETQQATQWPTELETEVRDWVRPQRGKLLKSVHSLHLCKSSWKEGCYENHLNSVIVIRYYPIYISNVIIIENII